MRTTRKARRLRERLTAVLAVAGAATLMTGFIVTGTAGTASAEVGSEGRGGQDHWYVCKYVGKPGVDERLQTGNNPIRLAAPAIKISPVVPGKYFADAQDDSYVLVKDEGQPAPTVADCPAPRPTVVTPAAPTFTDPTCDNKKATLTGADDTDAVDYTVEGPMAPGGTVVVTAQAKAGYAFPEDVVTSWSHNYPTIESLECGGGHQTIVVTPEGEPVFKDPCGTKFDKTIVPEDTRLVDWEKTYEGSTVTVTAQLRPNLPSHYVLAEGDWTWTYTFTDEPCFVKVDLDLSFVPDCVATHQWQVTNPSDVAVTAWYGLGKSVLVPAHGTATFTTDAEKDYAWIFWGGKGTGIWPGFDKEHAGADRTDCNYTPPPQPVLIPVTPEITYTDPCGTEDDTVNGVTKAGYTFVVDQVAGKVTFTAAPGYYISGPATLTAPWTDVPCPVEATPVAPTVVQSDECEVEGSYTIPDTPGVQYLIDDEPVEPGTYEGPIAAVVTAEAVGNTVLTVEDWSFDLVVTPATDCEVAPTEAADVCTNIKGAQTEVPEGYSLVEGLCVADEVAPTEAVSPAAPAVGPVVVPTAVDAGLPGPTSVETGIGSPLGLGLIGAGLMMLLAAGALQTGRRERGTHEF